VKEKGELVNIHKGEGGLVSNWGYSEKGGGPSRRVKRMVKISTFFPGGRGRENQTHDLVAKKRGVAKHGRGRKGAVGEKEKRISTRKKMVKENGKSRPGKVRGGGADI